MKTFLKIKIKSLAAEAKIIKLEEQKWKPIRLKKVHENDNEPNEPHPFFWSLRHHRLYEVRTECRAALLAYGYLRGRTYKQIENKSHDGSPPNMARVAELVRKFGRFKDIHVPENRKALNDAVFAWFDADEAKQAAE